MVIQYAAATHPGKVRTNNEDNFWVDGFFRRDVTAGEVSHRGRTEPFRFLAAVCDGMGGEASGETASLLTAESLRPHSLYELPAGAEEDIRTANGRICRYIEEHGGRRSGSTVAALYVDGGQAIACNVGDSRVYRFRDGRLTQLSRDHSRAQRLIDIGALTPEEARHSSARRELTQHLGIFEDEMILTPWFSKPQILLPGDRFLLCSDGLTDMLWDEEIIQILAVGSVKQQTEQLIQEALSSGGEDNITAVVLQAAVG